MAMKFYSAPASPFVRKVLVLAHETGQIGDLEMVPTKPAEVEAALIAVNPMSKIPALVTEDGVSLPESDMICLYLDERHSGEKIIPTGAGRWEALAREAVADGFMEAAVGRRGEDGRPDGERSQVTVDKLMARMMRCMDTMETDAAAAGDAVNIGTISLAVACGYADFRYPDLGWREGRPNLTAFYESFAKRASMEATQPPS